MTDRHAWQAAASFAARAHRHGLRKDKATPYIAHPARVALTVSQVFGCTDETVLVAALLHDVIEDTDVDYDDVLEHFGTAVADIVAALSKDARLVEAQREAAYDRQLAAGPWQARLIKIADVYDNFSDAHDENAQQKAVDRARRIITLAGDDPRLAGAVEALKQLVNLA